MDQYELEIQSIRRTLGRLKSDPGTSLQVLDEYEAELRNLLALFQATSVAFAAGEHDAGIRTALAELGFGAWTFDNLYAFVYDAAMEIDLGGRDFAGVVSHTDYAESLRAATEAQP